MIISQLAISAFNRDKFERNFHILQELMMNERFQVSSHVSLDGIMRVRYLPNKRINFLSVNESARSMANMAANMSNHHGE